MIRAGRNFTIPTCRPAFFARIPEHFTKYNTNLCADLLRRTLSGAAGSKKALIAPFAPLYRAARARL